MKLIFTRGTFREKLFSSMLFTTLTTLMLCSSLLLIVFSSRMEDSARQEADTLMAMMKAEVARSPNSLVSRVPSGTAMVCGTEPSLSQFVNSTPMKSVAM